MKAARWELLEWLDYVASAHEFCDVSYIRCDHCKATGYCPSGATNRCEGCEAYDRITEILTQEGMR